MSSAKERMRLAAELVSRGATLLADPCPKDGGVQVRYRGKVYCATHDDLSAMMSATAVTFDGVTARMRDVILSRLGEATAALEGEKDVVKQEQLVTVMTKYFELLQRLPQK